MIIDVAIIDYQMSNLHSVQVACNKVGLSSVITSDPDQILDAKAAILPGVGAFGEAMTHLTELRLDQCILCFVEIGRPFVGICLGLQLLFENSEEFGSHPGLGLIKGSVRKFGFNNIGDTKYPVPQVGWNQLRQNGQSWKKSLLRNSESGDFMYFVHSYFVEPDEEALILATTTYGDQKFCSAIQYGNIFATQFHPEKSGHLGLKIYESLRESIK